MGNYYDLGCRCPACVAERASNEFFDDPVAGNLQQLKKTQTEVSLMFYRGDDDPNAFFLMVSADDDADDDRVYLSKSSLEYLRDRINFLLGQ